MSSLCSTHLCPGRSQTFGPNRLLEVLTPSCFSRCFDMASPAGKVSTAKVLKCLKEYLNEHPETGPAILMSVQAGDLEVEKNNR